MKKMLSFTVVGALMISTTATISLAVAAESDQAGSVPLAPPAYGPLGGPGRLAMDRPLDGPDPVSLMQRALRRLDLTDAQKQQIKGILEANREGITGARDTRAAAIKAFAQAVQAGDEAAIRTAGTAVGNAIASMAVIRTQVVAAVKGVLTKEQIQQIEKMKERAKQSMRLAPGPRSGRPALDRPNPPKRNRRVELLNLLANEKVFNKIDRNGDGAITLQEINAFRNQLDKAQPEPNDAK